MSIVASRNAEVEKERKGRGPAATIYEVKFEKLANAKRRIVAWEFKQQDVSFAVEFEIYEEHYKKLKSMMNNVFRSFKLIDTEAAEAASTAGPMCVFPGHRRGGCGRIPRRPASEKSAPNRTQTNSPRFGTSRCRRTELPATAEAGAFAESTRGAFTELPRI